MEGDLSKCDDTIQALTTYYQPSTNIPHERHLFRSMTQLPEKTTEWFVTRVKKKAETCDFANIDEQIRDQIVEKCRSNPPSTEILGKGDRPLIKTTERNCLSL